MSITLQIPGSLRADCGGVTEMSLSASTVRAALDELEQTYPRLHRSICVETGAVRPHINLFVNESFVDRREGLDTPLQPGDVLAVIPAVSGG